MVSKNILGTNSQLKCESGVYLERIFASLVLGIIIGIAIAILILGNRNPISKEIYNIDSHEHQKIQMVVNNEIRTNERCWANYRVHRRGVFEKPGRWFITRKSNNKGFNAVCHENVDGKFSGGVSKIEKNNLNNRCRFKRSGHRKHIDGSLYSKWNEKRREIYWACRESTL